MVLYVENPKESIHTQKTTKTNLCSRLSGYKTQKINYISMCKL